jgi:Uma2 family endonuclease
LPTFSSDIRVALNHNTYAYPDCTVICGEIERADEDPNTVTNPRIVFEVLSPATERYDQGRKVFLYQNIPSLHTIVLVSPDVPWAQVIERQADESWVIRTYLGVEAVVPFPAIEAELPLGRLYDGF